MEKELLIIPCAFLLFGFFVIFNILWDLSYEKRFLSGNTSVTKGKIVGIDEHGGAEEGVYYTAKVEYWVGREIYRISGTDACLKRYMYIDPDKYHIGDAVDIAYKNNKPNDCIIKGSTKLSGRLVFAMVFGGIFIIIAIVDGCYILSRIII